MTSEARPTTDTVRLRRLAAQVARRILRERTDVVAIGIVGSVARGDAAPGSDLDLAVVVRRGPRQIVGVILEGSFLSLSFTAQEDFEREFTEAGAELAHRRGGLDLRVLYDPGGYVSRLRAKVARLPETVYKSSAQDALAEMYEYIGKLRNAQRRRDHRNLVYASTIVGFHAINLVGNVNRRDYASENTMWTEWRAFPFLPPRFADLVDVAIGFRRASDPKRAAATEALWSTCQRWAAGHGIRVPTIRSVRSLPIPGRKTT